MSLTPGTQLGRYRIVRRLGAGAMGEVYLAEDPQIERQLALKTVRLLAQSGTDPAELEARLLREAKAAGRLVHSHVVTLFDAGEADGLYFLAFEFVEGPDLSRRMKEPPPLTLGQILRIAREAAEGLAAAHDRGIVHRDIKPSNILLDTHGRVKVSDFGIAKMVGQQTELTQTGSVVGSPHYLSPEQVRGETLDGRSDLFSLGVVVYEMLTRRRPFDGESITTLVYQILSRDPVPIGDVLPALPAPVRGIVDRLLRKEKEERFAGATELVEAIREAERALPPAVLGAPVPLPRDTEETVFLSSADTGGGGADETGPTVVQAPPGPPPPPPPAAPAVVPPSAQAAATPTPSEPLPAGRGSRSVLPFLLGALLVVAVGLAAALWWVLDVRLTERPAVGDERPEMAFEAEPGESRGTEAVASEEDSAVDGEPWREETGGDEGGERPSLVERSPVSDPTSSETEPKPAETAATGTTEPPPAQAAPTRQTPVEPRDASPAAEPGAGGPEPSSRPAPTAAQESRLRAFLSERIDREMDTSTRLVFDVDPEDAFVLLRGRGDDRFLSLGQASEWSGGGDGRVYQLPEPGDYLLRFRDPASREKMVLIHASGGGGPTTIAVSLAEISGDEIDRGDLPRYRTADGIVLDISPRRVASRAQVLVDGRRVGEVDDFAGGHTPLRLAPGDHRVAIVGVGFRRIDFLVEVRPGHEERLERVELELTRDR